MNPSYYKYCMVPQCGSTSIKTPNKLFIFVPSKQEVRKKWLTLARKNNAHCFSTNSRMYFCEDHFDVSIYRNVIQRIRNYNKTDEFCLIIVNIV